MICIASAIICIFCPKNNRIVNDLDSLSVYASSLSVFSFFVLENLVRILYNISIR